jgi:hypothetical protein
MSDASEIKQLLDQIDALKEENAQLEQQASAAPAPPPMPTTEAVIDRYPTPPASLRTCSSVPCHRWNKFAARYTKSLSGV